jgi:ATP-binding cassette subfamily B protein
MNADLSERLAGIEVIQSSAQEDQERARFERAVARARDLGRSIREIEATFLPPLVLNAARALAFLYALYLVDQGTLTIGAVVAYMGLLARLHLPSAMLSSVIASGLTSAQRMLAVVRAVTEPRETPSGVRQPMQGGVVFEDVRFAYGDQDVLKGISFSAAPGETVAIVGQTGAGKTTLTRLIDRTYDRGGRHRRARVAARVTALADLSDRAGRHPLCALGAREHRLWPGRRDHA